MMIPSLQVLLLASVLGGIAGCVTLPQGTSSGAGYVGDRASVNLNEVVVSVPINSPPGFVNLHVDSAVIINPRQVSIYDPYDVQRLVKRLQPRINARLVEALLNRGPIAVADLPTLRGTVNAEAQYIVDEAVAKWSHASEYQLDVVIVALYFTDASVGRTVGDSRDFGW